MTDETQQFTGEIVRFTKTEQAIAQLETDFKGLVFDCTKSKEMVKAKEARRILREHRTALETARTNEKADALAYGRRVDAEAKKLRERIEALEDPISEQIKAEEIRKEAERAERERIEVERIAKENAVLDQIRDMPLAGIGKSAREIADVISALEALTFEEMNDAARERAISLRATTLQKLDTLLISATNAEALKVAQAKDEAARREQEENDRKAREEAERSARERAEAETAAQREREEADRKARQAQEDADRAERMKKEDEARAAQKAADDAERERLEKVAADQRAEDDRLNKLRIQQENEQRERDRIEREQTEAARIQKLKDGAPPLREAAIDALSLMLAKGLGSFRESIQLSAAIEKESQA